MKKEFKKPIISLAIISSSEIIATSGDANGTIDEVPWGSKERKSMWENYE